MPIDKTYNPAATEAKLYERWEKSGAFACDVKSTAQPFCIMMPPPNVTGSLHMGHALNFTLQDILARYRRMQGRDVLWQPGTDHAGIATQMMVEKQLAAEGKNMGRREMGRAKFLERVWQWKKESGDTITRQLRRLGASCDWSRERFTMDPALNKAVVKAFVQLYNEKLIYKDKRLVNWDPKLLTAVSDLEVEQREVKGHMWHFRYPLVDDPTKYICIATTRPETMLGDGAVAVHPSDERYKHLVGKYVTLPLANRQIPIIADEHPDPEKGSGAVKITAAHDFNDFEVWQRHRDKDYFKKQKDGGLINLFDAHARLNENAPEAYRGLDRYAARKAVIADLEALGLVDQIENITHAVPHGDRSGVVIEPWLSEQWYCKAEVLAKEALQAVEDKKTKFVPEQWTNTYRAWMTNIQPWCISRQLWWGHQIPAWYGLRIIRVPEPSIDFQMFVAETEEEARKAVFEHFGTGILVEKDSIDEAMEAIRFHNGASVNVGNRMASPEIFFTRDTDVLDTWFSSALWPFSTIGWPDATPELKRYYPTDVLVTGFDIIFFWVARMMMMGIHFMKDVPFRDVYIHALVRDEKGQKMSKTKGNVIDPLVIIDKYGCDALRFTLANMSTPGRDIKLAPARIEGNRNFATKLWNAARYCQMNECAWRSDFIPLSAQEKVNQWIIATTRKVVVDVEHELNDYRFDLASSAIYSFVWGTFCDWYLEFTKPILLGNDERAKTETRATTAWVLEVILRALHPFMPYITEELWGQLVSHDHLLMTRAWPGNLGNEMLPVFKANTEEIEWVKTLISAVRAERTEYELSPAAIIQLHLKDAIPIAKERVATHQSLIMRLARVSDISYVTTVGIGSVQIVLDDITLVLPLAQHIDFDLRRKRVVAEIEKQAAEIKKIENKLANKDFVDRAPPEIVEEQRERKAEAEAMLAKLQAAQKSLSA